MRPLFARRPSTLSPGFLAPDSEPTMKCWIVCARTSRISLENEPGCREGTGRTSHCVSAYVSRYWTVISSSCTVAAAPNEPFLPLRATTRTRSAFGSSGTSHDPEREINAPARERKLEAVPEALAHVEDGVVAQGAGRVSASGREDVQVEEGRQGRRQVSARRVARVSSTGPL